jgi:hypothetical protein
MGAQAATSTEFNWGLVLALGLTVEFWVVLGIVLAHLVR